MYLLSFPSTTMRPSLLLSALFGLALATSSQQADYFEDEEPLAPVEPVSAGPVVPAASTLQAKLDSPIDINQLPLRDWRTAQASDFWLEAVTLVALAAYILQFQRGSQRNKEIARAWYIF